MFEFSCAVHEQQLICMPASSRNLSECQGFWSNKTAAKPKHAVIASGFGVRHSYIPSDGRHNTGNCGTSDRETKCSGTVAFSVQPRTAGVQVDSTTLKRNGGNTIETPPTIDANGSVSQRHGYVLLHGPAHIWLTKAQQNAAGKYFQAQTPRGRNGRGGGYRDTSTYYTPLQHRSQDVHPPADTSCTMATNSQCR